MSTFSVTPNDPLSAIVECTRSIHMTSPLAGLDAAIWARQRMTSTATAFRIDSELQVMDGGAQIFAERWTKSFARDLV